MMEASGFPRLSHATDRDLRMWETLSVRRRLSQAAALVAVLCCLFLAVSEADAISGETFGIAKLEAIGRYPSASATARFVDFPNHVEIALKVQGLPRSGNPAHVVWLIAPGGRAHIGGAFPRIRHDGFSGSLIVPGTKSVSLRSARLANRMLITRVSRPRALRSLRKAQRSHWRQAVPVVGKRIVSGRIERQARRGS